MPCVPPSSTLALVTISAPAIEGASMTRSARRTNNSNPASYAIRVQGMLGDDWSDRLGQMRISTASDDDGPVTELVGRLPDQRALMSILSSLYDLGLPILSVERILST
jgi:hypothetical protein